MPSSPERDMHIFSWKDEENHGGYNSISFIAFIPFILFLPICEILLTLFVFCLIFLILAHTEDYRSF